MVKRINGHNRARCAFYFIAGVANPDHVLPEL